MNNKSAVSFHPQDKSSGSHSTQLIEEDLIKGAIHEAWEAGQISSAQIKYSTLISNIKGSAADEIRTQTALAIFRELDAHIETLHAPDEVEHSMKIRYPKVNDAEFLKIISSDDFESIKRKYGVEG